MQRPLHDMAMQAERGGGGIAPAHSRPGTRRRWVVSTTSRPVYPQERLGTHYSRGWVGLGASVNGMEELVPTGIRSPDRSRVASRYTDYDIPVWNLVAMNHNKTGNKHIRLHWGAFA
jgi:hypothetical protein